MPDQVEAGGLESREGGLHRSLNDTQLGMIAIGGAIGTGLFLGSGLAIGLAGPAVLASYAIGGAITLLLMGALAEMTIAHPVAGSFGAHAELYLGPMAGFLVRAAYLLGIVLAVGTEVTAVAAYMRFWWPQVPGWWWIAGFSAGLVAINAAKVSVFGWLEYALSLVKVLGIVAFLLLGSSLVSARGAAAVVANYTSGGGLLPHGLWGMWVAVLISIFSYFSIEMIAVAAGEAKDPRRAVVRAFKATMARLVLFYLGALALTLALTPWARAGGGGSPFVIVMRETRIPGADGVVNLLVLTAALSAMNSQLYVASRMLFSLARAGQAPAMLGTLSRAGVPLAALLASTAGVAVALVMDVLRPASAFASMLSIVMFMPLFVWAMIFVTHLRFRRSADAAAAGFRLWGYPYTSLLGAGLIAALLATTLFTAEFRLTLVCGLPVLALLAGTYWLRMRGAEPPAAGPAEGPRLLPLNVPAPSEPSG
jgi:L-asparagine transporter-like permease